MVKFCGCCQIGCFFGFFEVFPQILSSIKSMAFSFFELSSPMPTASYKRLTNNSGAGSSIQTSHTLWFHRATSFLCSGLVTQFEKRGVGWKSEHWVQQMCMLAPSCPHWGPMRIGDLIDQMSYPKNHVLFPESYNTMIPESYDATILACLPLCQSRMLLLCGQRWHV